MTIGEMGGITQKSIKPRGGPKAKRKPIAQQKEEAFEIFYNNGVRDPEEMWDELQNIKKAQPQVENYVN